MKIVIIMSNKKEYGQFFTKNYDYIFNNLTIPFGINKFIEPFAGEGDLINYIKKHNIIDAVIEAYDIEPKNKNINKLDTLITPPDFSNKFVITNPPYLARNKSSNKVIFDKYDQNDLYKYFIKILVSNKVKGGIIIIPLNFWCSIRKIDIKLRMDFLNIYLVKHMNIFEERVFEDTSYTVCSFLFELKTTVSKYKCNIIIKCIDDDIDNKINMKYVSDNEIYVDNTPKHSARTYMSITIEPIISKNRQMKLCDEFNNFIEEKREKYNSMFLTNYRESKKIARKRISFTLVFQIINYLLSVSL